MIKVELTMKDVVREGHPVLLEVAKDVSVPLLSDDIELATKMLHFVHASQQPELAEQYQLRPAAGIAAPQLGVSKKILAVSLPNGLGESVDFVFFNPTISEKSQELIYLEGGEGCLSVDREVEGIVPRYAQITVAAVDLKGEEVSVEFNGYLGIVIQHEIDHLYGTMFYHLIDPDNPMTPPQNATAI